MTKNVNNTQYEVITQLDPETGETIIPLPPELLQHLGWEQGDKIDFRMDESGRLVMTKRVG